MHTATTRHRIDRYPLLSSCEVCRRENGFRESQQCGETNKERRTASGSYPLFDEDAPIPDGHIGASYEKGSVNQGLRDCDLVDLSIAALLEFVKSSYSCFDVAVFSPCPNGTEGTLHD